MKRFERYETRRRRAAFAVGLLAVLTWACTSPTQRPRPETWAQPVAAAGFENLYKIDAETYRSEQPTRAGFEELRKMGVVTVLDLRNDDSDAALTAGLGFRLVEVPMIAARFTEEEIVKALQAIKDAEKPILIHCQFGADRTGLVSAMVRVVFQGWTKDEAIAELIHGGYGFHRYYTNIPEYIRGADVAALRARLKLP